jgi:hypothetical protein
MPDVSKRRFEEFIVEPMTDLGGTPVPAPQRFDLAHLQGRLGQLGIVALAEGLALLVCFCFPWYARPSVAGVTIGGSGALPIPLDSYSGWTTAVALPTGTPGVEVIFAPHLLLIPLCALALLVTDWLYMKQRVAARPASGIALALSVLALLIALSFWVWISSEEAVFQATIHSQTPVILYNTMWGCWLTLLVSGVSSACYIFLLKPGAPGLANTESAPFVPDEEGS